MNKIVYIVWAVVLIAVDVLAFIYLLRLLRIIFCSPTVSVLGQLQMYQWVAVGFVIYAIFRSRYIKTTRGYKNMEVLETDSHEHLHFVVALLFGRVIHSINSNGGSGSMVSSSRNKLDDVPVSLAPYCLPLYTYLLLLFRFAMDFRGRMFYDIIIGASMAFYYYCFKSQTGNHQTDINKYPLPFSYLYIVSARLVNLCLIIPAFFPNMNLDDSAHNSEYGQLGLLSSIYRMGCEFIDIICG